MATTHPLSWMPVFIFGDLGGESLGWPCEPVCTIEVLRICVGVFLEIESDKLILRKPKGGGEPLRNELTLSSYGIVDGSSLDFDVVTGDL